MKKPLVIIVALSLFGAIGCGGGDTASPDSADSPTEEAEGTEGEGGGGGDARCLSARGRSRRESPLALPSKVGAGLGALPLSVRMSSRRSGSC